MAEDLKNFEAVFARWGGDECEIVTIEFRVETERDAVDIAEDIAFLEGNELIYLSEC
jgi:hypothetical protein